MKMPASPSQAYTLESGVASRRRDLSTSARSALVDSAPGRQLAGVFCASNSPPIHRTTVATSTCGRPARLVEAGDADDDFATQAFAKALGRRSWRHPGVVPAAIQSNLRETTTRVLATAIEVSAGYTRIRFDKDNFITVTQKPQQVIGLAGIP